MKLTGLELHKLRDMIHVTAAFVAQRAGVGLERFAEIEAGDGAAASLLELTAVFHVLKDERRKQVLNAGYR